MFDPLMSDAAESNPYDDGILSAPRIVTQTNPIPAYKTPILQPLERYESLLQPLLRTRTPRITPFPTPPPRAHKRQAIALHNRQQDYKPDTNETVKPEICSAELY